MTRARARGVSAVFNDYRDFAGARLWLALALMLAGALAEGFGLLMIVPLATIAIGGASAVSIVAVPWIDSLPVGVRFLAALGLFVGAMVLRSVLLFARNLLLAELTAEYEADLRHRAAATLAQRGWSFARMIGQSGMQSILLAQVPRVAQAAAYIQQIAVAATMLAVQLALTFWLSLPLTMLAAGVLVLGATFSLRFTRRGVASGIAIGSAIDDNAESGFRLHAGLKAALAQGTVTAFLAEYRSSLARTRREYVAYARNHNFAAQVTAFGAALVAAILLLVGVQILALPFPVLIASLLLFARMTGPAQQLQSDSVGAAAYAPALAAIEEKLGRLDAGEVAGADDQVEPIDWHELKLDSAGYEHRPGLGLAPLSMTLRRGEWIGIEGASGAGKTTLLDLVAGLLPAGPGAISLDGRALDGEMLAGWRRGLAYVGQDGDVFNDSVRANLLADGGTSEDEYWRALEIVGLAERVRAFPAGLDQPVGDRGSSLSGGERQRLVIARALLRRPRLLILDEATAALDPEAEAAMLDRLKAIDPRPAALIVAHRESTLSHCDSRLNIQHQEASALE